MNTKGVVKTNNKLNEIQEMLINQMKRLDNNEIMKEDAKVTE